MGRSLHSLNGGGPTAKESRGGETARPLEKWTTGTGWEDCIKRDVKRQGRLTSASGGRREYVSW